MLDISGGTKYPRFYRITNPAALNAGQERKEKLTALQDAYEVLGEKLNADPLFVNRASGTDFYGFRLRNRDTRTDLEAWCKPDKQDKVSRLRAKKSKKWNTPAQEAWDMCSEGLAELAKKYPAVSRSADLEVLGVSRDMMMFGGRHSFELDIDGQKTMFLAIHWDIDMEGVTPTTVQDFEGHLEIAKKQDGVS